MKNLPPWKHPLGKLVLWEKKYPKKYHRTLIVFRKLFTTGMKPFTSLLSGIPQCEFLIVSFGATAVSEVTLQFNLRPLKMKVSPNWNPNKLCFFSQELAPPEGGFCTFHRRERYKRWAVLLPTIKPPVDWTECQLSFGGEVGNHLLITVTETRANYSLLAYLYQVSTHNSFSATRPIGWRNYVDIPRTPPV